MFGELTGGLPTSLLNKPTFTLRRWSSYSMLLTPFVQSVERHVLRNYVVPIRCLRGLHRGKVWSRKPRTNSQSLLDNVGVLIASGE